MAPKLPFVVQPRYAPIIERVGSEESGIIEIERRGYLTSGEKSFYQQIQQMNAGGTELIKLARAVSAKHGIDMKKAYDTLALIIQNGPRNKLSTTIEEEYSDEIQDVINALAVSQTREELVMATCLLFHRVSNEYTAADVAELHPDIINGLAELYRDEDIKSIEKLESGLLKDKEESIEEIEKKP